MVWKDILISQICSVQNGYAFKSSDFKVRSDYKVIKIKELKQGKITISSDTSEVAYNPNLEKYSLKRGDILFALTGDPVSRPNPSSWVGRVARFDCDDYSYLNQRVCKINFSAKIDSNYFYYYFLQKDIFKELAGKARGSASQANISGNDILNMHISLPDIKTQNKIANILSSLDAKIENNNKINANLEAQAAALFKSWYSKCTDEVTIGDLSLNITDYTKCTKEKVVLINSSDVTEGHFDHHNYTENKNLKGHFKKRFKKGDILYSQVRPRNRHWAYCNFEQDDYLASTQLMVIRSKDELISSILLYQYIISDDVWNEFTLKTETRSGTFPQGNYEEMSAIKVKFSRDSKEISEQLEVLYSLIYNNLEENQRLSSLRDTLLPKLMSGEIEL